MALCQVLYAGMALGQEVKSPIERAAEQLRAKRSETDATRALNEAIHIATEKAEAALKSAKDAQRAADQAIAAAHSAMTFAKQAMESVRAAGSSNPSKLSLRGNDPPSLSNDPLVVHIDGNVRYQMMQGFGSSARLFEDVHVYSHHSPGQRKSKTILTAAQQDKVLNALYRTLGLTRVRLNFERGFETRNDNPDPDIADLSKFNFSWTKNDALVRFAQRVIARGAKTVFPSSGEFEKWMSAGTDPAEFAEQILVRLRRWRELGMELEYFSIVNEPGFTRGGIWSGAFIRDVILKAGPRLRAEGFRTKFVVPDDWGPSQTYERIRVILADPRARKHVGAIAFHLYRGGRHDLARLKELGKKYAIPLWMTEYSIFDGHMFNELYGQQPRLPLYWAILMNDLIVDYDVSAVDYMFGFMGQWSEEKFPGATFVVLQHDGPVYQGFRQTKQYYMMGQFSKFIRPGARRIKAEVEHGDIRVSAFEHGKQLTLVGINGGPQSRRVKFTVKSDSLLPLRELHAVRTGEAENWRELEAIRLTGNAFEVTLPPRSVTTFFSDPKGNHSASKP